MNTVAIVACLVLGCIAISEAQINNYGGRTRPITGNRYCYDYLGNPVAPGDSFYDGCNTCFCGTNGMPAGCTRRACIGGTGGQFIGGGRGVGGILDGIGGGRVW